MVRASDAEWLQLWQEPRISRCSFFTLCILNVHLQSNVKMTKDWMEVSDLISVKSSSKARLILVLPGVQRSWDELKNHMLLPSLPQHCPLGYDPLGSSWIMFPGQLLQSGGIQTSLILKKSCECFLLVRQMQVLLQGKKNPNTVMRLAVQLLKVVVL